MLEGITPVHLIIILVVALLILGPGKLPETGAALGKAVREFRHGLGDTIAQPPDGAERSAVGDAPPPGIPPSTAP